MARLADQPTITVTAGSPQPKQLVRATRERAERGQSTQWLGNAKRIGRAVSLLKPDLAEGRLVWSGGWHEKGREGVRVRFGPRGADLAVAPEPERADDDAWLPVRTLDELLEPFRTAK